MQGVINITFQSTLHKPEWVMRTSGDQCLCCARTPPASLLTAQDTTEAVEVPRGCLLTPAEPLAFHSKLVMVTVDVRDLPGVRANVSMKEVQEVTWPQQQILAALRGPETRYTLLSSRWLAAAPNNLATRLDIVRTFSPGLAIINTAGGGWPVKFHANVLV